MNTPYFDQLSEILFDGDVKTADFRVEVGTEHNNNTEELCKSLIDSFERMGLTKDNVLVDINK